MRVMLASVLLLGACQSTPDAERGRTVTVRMVAGHQAIAEQMCGGPVSPVEIRQGTNQIVYRCVEGGS